MAHSTTLQHETEHNRKKIIIKILLLRELGKDSSSMGTATDMSSFGGSRQGDGVNGDDCGLRLKAPEPGGGSFRRILEEGGKDRIGFSKREIEIEFMMDTGIKM